MEENKVEGPPISYIDALERRIKAAEERIKELEQKVWRLEMRNTLR